MAPTTRLPAPAIGMAAALKSPQKPNTRQNPIDADLTNLPSQGDSALTSNDSTSTKDLESSADDKNVNINPKGRPPLKHRESWLDDILPEEQWIDSIRRTSRYVANFDWERSFWKPTNLALPLLSPTSRYHNKNNFPCAQFEPINPMLF